MDGAWYEAASVPGAAADPHRRLEGNPYKDAVMKFALDISQHKYSLTQLTAILETVANATGTSPFTDLAKNFFPRNSGDIEACMSQTQAQPVIGWWCFVLFRRPTDPWCREITCTGHARRKPGRAALLCLSSFGGHAGWPSS